MADRGVIDWRPEAVDDAVPAICHPHDGSPGSAFEGELHAPDGDSPFLNPRAEITLATVKSAKSASSAAAVPDRRVIPSLDCLTAIAPA
jgi:hypothetical protein